MSRKYSKSSTWFTSQAKRQKERLIKAYDSYLEQFSRRKTSMILRGLKPADTQQLTFNEFVGLRKIEKSMGVASGNITRTIISSQLYEFTQTEAEDIYSILEDLDMLEIDGKKVSIESIRGGAFGNKLLLDKINTWLRDTQMISSSYDRAEWITHKIFGDSR